MKWQDRRRSSNVEDRRGQSSGGGGGLGGLGGLGGGRIPTGGRAGIGGIGGIIIIVILMLITGGNPLDILTGGNSGGLTINQGAEQNYQGSDSEEQMADFVSVVLAETEACWQEQFKSIDRTYENPNLVLYTGYVDSACGSASSASGPFYCSGDAKVYLDLSFFDELANKLGAQGDFAIAYVIAHEVGHHVQYQLGIGQQVAKLKQQMSETEANALSVRMELQADYFAGLWANYAEREGILDLGDVDEAINAASKIGDDVLMGAHARPDAFTHGTAAQRARWFKKGYEYGTISDGDTFAAKSLEVTTLPILNEAVALLPKRPAALLAKVA